MSTQISIWLAYNFPMFVTFCIPLYIPRMTISRTLMKGDMGLDLRGLQSISVYSGDHL